jgi:hypothetical protein
MAGRNDSPMAAAGMGLLGVVLVARSARTLSDLRSLEV